MRYLFGSVLAIALVIRVGALLALPQFFAFEQTGTIHGSAAYDEYALNLLETGVYGRVPGEPDAMLTPVYSYVLAGVYALFGRGGWQVGLFHTVLDLFSIGMLFAISTRIMPRYGAWCGALAGLFFAGYPYLVFHNLTLIDTAFFIALMYAFILLMVLLRAQEQRDWRTWVFGVLAGLILGLALLTRSSIAPLAPLLALWLLFRLRLWDAILRTIPVAVVSVLLLVPWIVRNERIYDAFIPFSLIGGANFYQGSNANTVPFFRAGYDVQWVPTLDLEGERVATESLSPLEQDALLNDLGWAYLRENPDKIPELIWVKVLVYWSIDITPRRNPVAGVVPPIPGATNLSQTDDTLEVDGVPEDDPVLAYGGDSLLDRVGRPLHRVYFGGLFVLSLVGFVMTLPHWRDVSLIWLVQIGMTVIYVLFHPSTRYRAPTDPLLFLFSAYALVVVWMWMRTPAPMPLAESRHISR